jgi:hypothetical protein
MTYKLSYLSGSEWEVHSYPPLYETQSTNTTERLVATIPNGDAAVFEKLVGSLTPPYLLLYVLHTPRTEGEAGRYQSPPLSPAEFHALMSRFGAYFGADGRFDLWGYSPTEQATVVWDRHNLIYAYGPLESYATTLRALGFSQGKCETPGPHTHHYRSENDTVAQELLSYLQWIQTPLRPEDEQ